MITAHMRRPEGDFTIRQAVSLCDRKCDVWERTQTLGLTSACRSLLTTAHLNVPHVKTRR